MGFGSTLKKQATGLGQKALERLFADEKRAMQVAEALGAVQRGKAKLDSTQRVVMHQLNFATKGDFKALGKQMSGLKRRLRELDAKLQRL
jgi:polyhydroxyalkanoate synthesis regulator phasin